MRVVSVLSLSINPDDVFNIQSVKFQPVKLLVVFEGLKNIKMNKDVYNSKIICTTSEQYTWENIVKLGLKEYLSEF